MFEQEASQRQLCLSVVNTFWQVHVVPRALVWQINQNILDEKQSRPVWLSSTFGNCLPSTRNLSLQYFPLGEASWVFTAKLVIYTEICSSCCHSTPQNFETRESLQPFPKVFKCTRLCSSFPFLKIKLNISLWPKQHNVSSHYSWPTFRELT